MKRVGSVLAAALFVTVGFVGALGAQQSRAEIALRSAIDLEVVRGDVKGAIEEYQRIADVHKDNRAVAAQALVRLAEAYQKLGDSHATATYERIVREFSDQSEAAALARARLRRAAPVSGDGIVQRTVKTGRHVRAFTPSPDGRYLAFANWANGHLAVHDLAAGVERDVTRESPVPFENGQVDFPVFTPDSRRILYATRTPDAPEIRIVNVEGGGMRTLLRNAEYRYLSPHGVSPDGGTVAALIGHRDQTWQIALVTLDGTLRVLKSTGWDRPSIGNFSADGRWIVYSVRTPEAGRTDHEVHAISVDGQAEVKVASAAARDTPFFSPDASRIIFTGERLGKRVLWSVRVANAKPVAPPEVVRTDAGTPMGFTSAGSLYLRGEGSRIGVFTASMNPGTWRLTGQPREITNGQRYFFAIDPVWSPDGTSIAYSVPANASGASTAYQLTQQAVQSRTTTIVIRNQITGQERELSVAGGRLRGWLDDGRSLLLHGTSGLRTVQIDTGSERILLDKQVGLAVASMDGKAIFYFTRDAGFSQEPGTARPAVQTVRVIKRDVASGEERELCRLDAARGIITDLVPSSDGSHVAFIALLPTEEGRLFVASASGGVRQVERPIETLAAGFAWTGDGKALVFVGGSDEHAKARALAIPVDGGAPYATGIEAIGLHALDVHPAGHVAFAGSVRESDDITVLERLFPRQSRK